MKRLWLLFLALSIVALVSHSAWAQRGGGRGFGGGFNTYGLLVQKSVQQELKLSAEQIEQLTAELDKQRAARGELEGLGREERQAKFAERRKAAQEELSKILKPDQLKRFNQIVLQRRGPQALADNETAAAIGLSDDQKQKVQAIDEELRGQMRELFQVGADDRDEARKKMESLRTSTNEKLQALLTPEQQARWKELTGEPFKGLIEPGPRRGGRRDGADRRRRDSPDPDTRASSARGLFRLAGFKPDDDDNDDDKAENKKAEGQNDDDPAQGKHAAKGKKKPAKADRHHAKAKKHHGSRGPHQTHYRRRGPHMGAGPRDREFAARHRGGPHADVWERVARAMGDHPRGHGRGPGFRGAGQMFFLHSLSREDSDAPAWANHGRRDDHRPTFAYHTRHRDYPHAFAHRRGHRPWAPGRHGPWFGHEHGRTPELAHRHGGHPHAFAHFSDRGPHSHWHHFASWRGRHPLGPGHFERRRDNDRGGPPPPPRHRDDRRSDFGPHERHRTADGPRDFDPSTPGDRLAQLERSLELLARQIESLREELRR
jgi:hypothetical protein